jgi:hypothetical protein
VQIAEADLLRPDILETEPTITFSFDVLGPIRDIFDEPKRAIFSEFGAEVSQARYRVTRMEVMVSHVRKNDASKNDSSNALALS